MIVLCAIFLACGAVSAQDFDPENMIPAPFVPELVKTPSCSVSASFEQGEFYRKYAARSSLLKPLPGNWFTLDSADLLASPRLHSDLIAENARASFTLYREWLPGLFAGPSANGFSNGTYLHDDEAPAWQTENDQEQLGLWSEYAPADPFLIGLSAGLQSNGLRDPHQEKRRYGLHYDFKGSALTGPALLPSLGAYCLAVRSSAGLVPENVSSVNSVRLGGTTPLEGGDYFAFSGGVSIAESRAFHLIKTDRANRFLGLKLHQSYLSRLNANYLFGARQNRLDYPDDSLNNKQETALTGGLNSLFTYKKAEAAFEAYYTRSSLDYAYTVPLEEAPADPAALSAAGRHLMNEIMGDLTLKWSAKYRYFREFPAFFSRTMNVRRFDHPFSYTDPANERQKNLDTRDIIRDRDTLVFVFPAFDTGKVRFSRGSLLENFLDSSRSSLNHLSTTYSAGLTYILHSKKRIYTREELTISVNEDSLFYVWGQESPHRFFRRREFYSFNDLKFIPFFKGTDDSVIVSPLYSIEEAGSMHYGDDGGSRFFLKTGVTSRTGLNLGLCRPFLPGLTAGCGWQFSRSTGYERDEFYSGGASYAGAEKLWRKIFSVQDDFMEKFTSSNSEWSAFLSYARKALAVKLEARKILTRFDGATTSDYLFINLNAGWKP